MANVLLIDDDVMSRLLLQTMLLAAGNQVDVCDGASEGMRTLAAQPYDVVVTDIFMPEMDGLEILRAITTLHPRLPVIAVSGCDAHGFDFLIAARCFGAAATLRKPVSRAELCEAVERVVAQHSVPS